MGLTMISIPEILHNDEYRFILVKKRDKIAIEPRWGVTNNYRYDNAHLLEKLNTGYNYGVLPRGGLCVLDSDNTKKLDDLGVLRLFEDTLIVRTNGGHHFYFKLQNNDNLRGKIYLDTENDEHLGHINISGNFYVVGPRCIHPKGAVYEIINEAEPITLSKDELLSLISVFNWEEQTAKEIKKSICSSSLSPSNVSRSYCFTNNITISDIFSPPSGARYLSTGEIICATPWHDSKTGTNLCINPSHDVWYCFRHKTGGDPLIMHAVMEDIIDCQDAGPGCLDKETFKKAIKPFEEMKKNKESQKILERSKRVKVEMGMNG